MIPEGLARLVIEGARDRQLDDDLRNRLAARTTELQLEGIQPRFGSLERDPVEASVYYLAADAKDSLSVLLRITPDCKASAVPFASSDHEQIRDFAKRIYHACLPRPQKASPAIAAGNRHPEISLPAAFDAFGSILKETGRNLASTVQLSATREMTTDQALAVRDGEEPAAPGHTRVSIQHLYHAGLWAAIRSGWRAGYTAEADRFIISGDAPQEISRSVESAKEAIRHAAGYTKFTTDTSRLFILESDPRHPAAWSVSAVEQKFHMLFPDEERRWILSEFQQPFLAGSSRYDFTRDEVVRLAVKFGPSLKLNEELFDFIRQVKAGGEFDFEPSIDEADTLTTSKELLYYMHWLQARGRPVQLVPPNLGFKKRQAYPECVHALREYVQHKMWPELLPRVAGEFSGQPLEELAHRVRQLAEVARHFDATLSIHSGSGKQAAVLESIGEATTGRLNYKISGELQLQLFDVLAEQPETSLWRSLYRRMVDRANEFASRGAFGAESELAAKNEGAYLGDTERGRVDGNLFLVFWLGNVVGSRDIYSPDGDHRFFKAKLDDLPATLLSEVRRRNQRYIRWLAKHLFG